MEIYLNENNLNYINKSDYDTTKKILNEIKNKLNNEVILEVYLNDIEIDLSFLENNHYSINEVDKIKFKTKNINILMLESLDSAQDFLPDLKDTLDESLDLFNRGYQQKARENYNSIIEGINWYLEVLKNVLQLIKDDQIIKRGNNLVQKFNNTLKEMMIILTKKSLDLLNEDLVKEFNNFVNQFIDFNKILIKKLKESEL